MFRQVLRIIFVLWLAATLCFLALRILPGDAIEAQFAAAANPTAAAMKREALGLDEPLPLQYARYMVGLLRGDAGVSLYSGQTVTEMILQRFPVTAELAVWSMLIAVSLGLFAGVTGGMAFGWLTTLVNMTVNLLFSIPVYWTATAVLFVIGVRVGGVQGNVVLPALVVGLHTSAAIARVTRSGIEETAHEDFIRTARSKGLPERMVLFRHILRASIAPVITVIALQTGILFSGAIITESIFQRTGMGLLLLDAVLARDYPVVQGVVIVMAAIYLAVNGLADTAARLLDPRVTA